MDAPILQCIELRKDFESSGGLIESPAGLVGGLITGRKRYVRAVDGVSFSVQRGETLSLVGSTGSGKTTTGRMIMRLIEPTSGSIIFEEQDLTKVRRGRELRSRRRDMQMIFQDPTASLNPRMRVVESVGLPLQVYGVARGKEKRSAVRDLLEEVGLNPVEKFIDAFPHELSGGQRQRVAIARALALRPKLVVADEPVSALDVSARAGVLNLLQALKEKYSLSYVVISHDLNMVRWMGGRIAIMRQGKIVEIGSTEAIFGEPHHAYTKALLAAVLVPDPTIPYAKEVITLDLNSHENGELVSVGPDHFVRQVQS
jgi:ABC-type oligopeptide transport system ATPase subunit